MNHTKSNELTEAISNVVSNQTFFATLLFDLMRIVEDANMPTAATDERTIWVGEWFRRLPIKQRVFVLCHEIYHTVFRHCSRAKLYADRGFGPDLKPFNFKKWNMAGDYYINALLKNDNIGEMPPQGLYNPNICNGPDTTIEDIYLALPDEQGDDGDENDEGGHGGFDQHKMPQSGGKDAGPSEQQVKEAVTAAKNAAKARGDMPGGLARVIDRILEPEQPWKQLLKDYVMSTTGKEDTSWARPNRRRLVLPPHVPFPGSEGFAMGTMVVAVDVSGSIGPDELAAFLGEIKGIIEQVRPRELYLMPWDTAAKVHKVESVEDLEELATSEGLYGGGGTDYSCVPPLIEDEWIQPEIVICLTDGYVAWPSVEPEWNHLTVTTGHDCPFGKSIKMDINRDVI